jgi:hypothetical protein
MSKSKFDSKTVVTQKTTDSNAKVEKEIYEQIWTTQQAINMAVAERRVVRFKTNKTNKEIKAQIDDIKGCALRKPDKDANEVAVIPPGIEDFCFEQKVDESLIVIPKPVIYRP